MSMRVGVKLAIRSLQQQQPRNGPRVSSLSRSGMFLGSTGTNTTTKTTRPTARSLSSALGAINTSNDKASVTTDTPPHKSIFSKLWDKHSPQGQQRNIEMGERLFRSAQRQANNPIWHGPAMVGRDFRARHAMTTMHVWFLHKRLVSDANDPHRSLLIQEELFDIFWHDTKSRIRAEGVNELTVNKHLKDVQQYTFQHLTHYDHVFLEYAADPDKRFEEIAALIWIHVLLRDEEALDDQLKRLAAYVEFQFDNMIFQCPDEYFHEGRIDWGNVPEFSNMKDNSGKPLPPVPLHPDDVLPGTWLKHLTDAGQTYYWNPDKRLSQWERPTKP